MTLDDDLMDLIRREAVERKVSFRAVLNERLRLGYAVKGEAPRWARFRVEPFDTAGFAPGVDEKKLNQIADQMDVED